MVQGEHDEKGVKNGRIIQVDRHGSILGCQFALGEKHGACIEIKAASSEVQIGTWNRGNKNGLWTHHYHR